MLDLFEIVYAPSLQALTASPNDRGPATLAAVVNPTGDLPGTVQEAAVVASFFPTGSASALAGEQASLDGVLALLKGRTHWHFASHGVFVWDDARASALVLNGDERLSVGRLLETEGLGAPRLVVLSACETGLYDIDRNADEFVGLAGAFVAMGAGGVIATLWPVDDTATSLLMAKLYKLHIEGGLPPARALQEAQTWLRSASEQQLQAFEQELARAQPVQAASAEGSPRLAFNRVRPRTKGSNAGSAVSVTEVVPEHPYAHPYYWAGFILTGQ
jgi:CHAT domain-containing protein